ncbi:hypothetical protein CONPUDRAFT_93130 [Coniophora puteana RWD-64-598 SS2]|uniref:PH domain-containing protein n=1 Tax=Coniophora puteana (strain RWD-64-598) TaxID=741705 RepID=A0A5M3MAM0_CONPW|nr:uncharacterized protein CONPUDRAFT_93130 [Coniophora puteana RWD-64-598 SS2]EIW75830.1 hypothetical protein CONPUDRAFT_93130 [Coniophora puteana RWD-64-598 SS2]
MASIRSPSVRSLTTTSNTSEPLYQVKLLAAIRSGDPALIHPFLAEISKEQRASIDGNLDTGAAALHLAIRCANLDTVQLLLSHRAISPNGVHPPGSGTSPLHLAASLGRVDVVALLLDQPGIDDTMRDASGRTCREVARGRDVIKLDLSYLDDYTGTALLHEAARRKDLRLIESAVRAGADVFVRDRGGRMTHEGSGKDDRVKVFLRQFANSDQTLVDAGASGPVVLKGYLSKYTNVARGYSTRWFVLQDGVLSYYRHQDDETVASRGAISMKTATVRYTAGSGAGGGAGGGGGGGENKRGFEVQSSASHGHSQKWYVKANHPVEAARWMAALQKAVAQAQDTGEGSPQQQGVPQQQQQQQGTLTPHSSGGGGGGGKMARTRTSLGNVPLLTRKMTGMSVKGGTGTVAGRKNSLGQGSIAESLGGMGVSASGSSMALLDPRGRASSDARSLVPSQISREGSASDELDDAASSMMDGASGGRGPPHGESFELSGNAAGAQMEMLVQLLAALDDALPSDGQGQNKMPTLGNMKELKSALLETCAAAQSTVGAYVGMARERDEWWRARLRRERERQSVWEESLATVVREGEVLERELRARARERKGVSVLGGVGGVGGEGGAGQGTVRRRSAMQGPVAVASPPPSGMPPAGEEGERAYFPPAGVQPVITTTAATPLTPPGASAAAPGPATATMAPVSAAVEDDAGSDGMDTDDEDEFFDAIETGTLPNLTVSEILQRPASAYGSTSSSAFVSSAGTVTHARDDTAHSDTDTAPTLSPPSTLSPLGPRINLAPLKAYERLRSALPLGSDTRPPASLWSVLKHSIGKDLTRISFPVFFNEPTSMLQRMAEDMEFSECLDVAAREKDAHRRIAFVAAFAMSNYSSTIGRIAKPFNPMLSETFEYVRLDKEYRYMSEQVSHHPPISACWAESPCWNYYGEVDAQNKFMGKSFEIRPTGVAHADLFLPEEWAPNYPTAKGKSVAASAEGKVVEHYSWKKVTTNVSGFILGNPTIDHYGDMVVTNHRTGDECVLTFKPRGWRGKDAYEISGFVRGSDGSVTYEIAGRWNAQLIARAVGTGSGFLHPDVSIGSGPQSPSFAPEYILLWRNSEKPRAPFNLTPFAVTLNDCPEDTLRPYLCPTDCRLRPDQRAFENGKYELANELKQRQEEKQRATRKAREEGRVPAHRPRWFSALVDGDTRERVWMPARVGEGDGGHGDGDGAGELEYWAERERVWRALRDRAQGGEGEWRDVDSVFIDSGPRHATVHVERYAESS